MYVCMYSSCNECSYFWSECIYCTYVVIEVHNEGRSENEPGKIILLVVWRGILHLDRWKLLGREVGGIWIVKVNVTAWLYGLAESLLL